jgi:hypothetical protein
MVNAFRRRRLASKRDGSFPVLQNETSTSEEAKRMGSRVGRNLQKLTACFQEAEHEFDITTYNIEELPETETSSPARPPSVMDDDDQSSSCVTDNSSESSGLHDDMEIIDSPKSADHRFGIRPFKIPANPSIHKEAKPPPYDGIYYLEHTSTVSSSEHSDFKLAMSEIATSKSGEESCERDYSVDILQKELPGKELKLRASLELDTLCVHPNESLPDTTNIDTMTSDDVYLRSFTRESLDLRPICIETTDSIWNSETITDESVYLLPLDGTLNDMSVNGPMADEDDDEDEDDAYILPLESHTDTGTGHHAQLNNADTLLDEDVYILPLGSMDDSEAAASPPSPSAVNFAPAISMRIHRMYDQELHGGSRMYDQELHGGSISAVSPARTVRLFESQPIKRPDAADPERGSSPLCCTMNLIKRPEAERERGPSPLRSPRSPRTERSLRSHEGEAKGSGFDWKLRPPRSPPKRGGQGERQKEDTTADDPWQAEDTASDDPQQAEETTSDDPQQAEVNTKHEDRDDLLSRTRQIMEVFQDDTLWNSPRSPAAPKAFEVAGSEIESEIITDNSPFLDDAGFMGVDEVFCVEDEIQRFGDVICGSGSEDYLGHILGHHVGEKGGFLDYDDEKKEDALSDHYDFYKLICADVDEDDSQSDIFDETEQSSVDDSGDAEEDVASDGSDIDFDSDSDSGDSENGVMSGVEVQGDTSGPLASPTIDVPTTTEPAAPAPVTMPPPPTTQLAASVPVPVAKASPAKSPSKLVSTASPKAQFTVPISASESPSKLVSTASPKAQFTVHISASESPSKLVSTASPKAQFTVPISASESPSKLVSTASPKAQFTVPISASESPSKLGSTASPKAQFTVPISASESPSKLVSTASPKAQFTVPISASVSKAPRSTGKVCDSPFHRRTKSESPRRPVNSTSKISDLINKFERPGSQQQLPGPMPMPTLRQPGATVGRSPSPNGQTSGDPDAPHSFFWRSHPSSPNSRFVSRDVEADSIDSCVDLQRRSGRRRRHNEPIKPPSHNEPTKQPQWGVR